MIVFEKTVHRSDLGDKADYWFAVAIGLPPDGKWMTDLPSGVKADTVNARDSALNGRKANTRFTVSLDPEDVDTVLFRAEAMI